MYQTPKRHRASTGDGDDVVVEQTRVLQPRSCNEEGPPGRSPRLEKCSPGEARRGRPRATLLSALILEGSTSPSNIKCKYCGRVFPREKSLQAHLRTHTGEKPYACDYPRCSRRFAQSGQLKTHQRLHTGEKPFVCTASSCSRRFTHANRHCPDHPDVPLKRLSPESNPNKKYDDDHNAEVREWLINWDKRQKAGEGPNVTPKKSIFRREESVYSNGSYDLKSSPKSELDDSDMSLYNSSSDNTEFDQQPDSTSASTPRSELPKKRWLREAVRNQNLWDPAQESLAFPINWNDETDERNVVEGTLGGTLGGALGTVVANENQNRPSVLVCVQGGKSKEISNEEIQGAMALVELKNSVATDYKYRV